MITKIIGSVLICASSSMIGLYFANLENFRIEDLNEWKKALLVLKSEIAFASAPLPEAMEHIAERTLKPIQLIFHTFAASLRENPKEGVPTLWRAAILQWKHQSFMTREDWEWLCAFGSTLGYLDKSMQINTIEMTVAYIDGKVNVLERQSEKSKKMFRSLGVLGGLLLAIILW